MFYILSFFFPFLISIQTLKLILYWNTREWQEVRDHGKFGSTATGKLRGRRPWRSLHFHNLHFFKQKALIGMKYWFIIKLMHEGKRNDLKAEASPVTIHLSKHFSINVLQCEGPIPKARIFNNCELLVPNSYNLNCQVVIKIVPCKIGCWLHHDFV